jgi:hypothetical protein
MDYKVKDLIERINKEPNKHLKNKMLFMWVKQNHITLNQYEKIIDELYGDECVNCDEKK